MTSDLNSLTDATPGWHIVNNVPYLKLENGGVFRLDFDKDKKNLLKKEMVKDSDSDSEEEDDDEKEEEEEDDEEEEETEGLTKKTIKNKKENRNMTDEQSTTSKTDLTSKQVRENYWGESGNPETKQDGSLLKFEARRSKCVEAGEGDMESCTKKVKKEMVANGSENTNINDMKEKKEDLQEVKICPKKLAALEEKAKQFDMLQKEKEELQKQTEKIRADFTESMKVIEEIKKERATAKETERQEKAKKISEDFGIPFDEVKSDSIEELGKWEKRFNFIVEKSKPKEVKQEDMDKQIMSLETKYMEMAKKTYGHV